MALTSTVGNLVKSVVYGFFIIAMTACIFMCFVFPGSGTVTGTSMMFIGTLVRLYDARLRTRTNAEDGSDALFFIGILCPTINYYYAFGDQRLNLNYITAIVGVILSVFQGCFWFIEKHAADARHSFGFEDPRLAIRQLSRFKCNVHDLEHLVVSSFKKNHVYDVIVVVCVAALDLCYFAVPWFYILVLVDFIYARDVVGGWRAAASAVFYHAMSLTMLGLTLAVAVGNDAGGQPMGSFTYVVNWVMFSVLFTVMTLRNLYLINRHLNPTAAH